MRHAGGLAWTHGPSRRTPDGPTDRTMPALTPVPRRTVLRLRPATLDDRRAIYEALARSDVTPHLLPGTGSGTGGEPPLSFEAFAADYTAPFFDGSAPALGRSYVVECDGLPVGHVSHSEIRRGATELDIWMFGERWCGRGHGTVALRLLLDVLAAEGRATGFVIRPSARNARAVRSYEKAGFRRTPLAQDDVVRWFGPDDVADPVHLSTGLVPGDGGPPAPAPPHVVTRRPATPADRAASSDSRTNSAQGRSGNASSSSTWT